MPACGSPRLFAACHVLHRLLLPRHPPCALSSLTIKFTRRTNCFAQSEILFPFFVGTLLHRQIEKCPGFAPTVSKALKKTSIPLRFVFFPPLFSCKTSYPTRLFLRSSSSAA